MSGLACAGETYIRVGVLGYDDQRCAAPEALRFGYTLADMHRITASALTADRSLAMDYRERWDIAWSAVVEELYAAPHWPTWHQLVQAGWQAIYAEVRAGRQAHGYRDREFDAGHGSAPRFAKFWFNPGSHGPEDGVVERVATWQILPSLGNPYREALLAVAAHDDYQKAADALGINYKALTQRLRVARQTFEAHWFQGETPPGHRGSVDACGRGHAWVEHGYINRQGKRHCRACARLRQASERRKFGWARKRVSA